MRKFEGALMSCALMAASALFASKAADAYSSKVKDACARDYQNFARSTRQRAPSFAAASRATEKVYGAFVLEPWSMQVKCRRDI